MARRTDLDQKIIFRHSENMANALGKIPKPKDVLAKMKIEGKNEIEVFLEKTGLAVPPNVSQSMQGDFENEKNYFANNPKFNKIAEYTKSTRDSGDFKNNRKERLKNEGQEEELENEPDEENEKGNEEKNEQKEEGNENEEENKENEEEENGKDEENDNENEEKKDADETEKEGEGNREGEGTKGTKGGKTAEAGGEAGTEVGAEAGAEAGGMAAAEGGVTAAGAGGAAAAGGGAVAVEGAAAGGGFITVVIAALPEILLALCIIGVILVIIIGAIMLFSGKSGNEPAKAVGNNSNFKVVSSMSNKETLVKALDKEPDEFVKQINRIKDGAAGDNKSKITELCDQIISKTNDLKDKSKAGIDATPEDKGKKEKLRIEIIDLVNKLLPLIQNIISIAHNEIGVCSGTKEFSTKRFNNGDAWCAAFVQYVFEKAGIILPSTDLAPNLYCAMQKDTTRYITFEAGKGMPQTNDIVFFGWADPEDGWCNKEIMHVGIVKEVISSSEIITIEGNTSSDKGSSCVAEKPRYIEPNYGGSGARFFARVK